MPVYQWIISTIILVAGLGWGIFVYWSNRQSRIAVHCTPYKHSDFPDEQVTNRSWPPTKMAKISVTNIGLIPVSIVGIEVLFKRINLSRDKNILELLENPICLQPQKTHDVGCRLVGLWLDSMAAAPYCIKNIPVSPDNALESGGVKQICHVKAIYAVTSRGKRKRVDRGEVKRLNYELFDAAFVSF